LATENRTQDAGHARFNISTKNKTESAQEFGRYLSQIQLSALAPILDVWRLSGRLTH